MLHFVADTIRILASASFAKILIISSVDLPISNRNSLKGVTKITLGKLCVASMSIVVMTVRQKSVNALVIRLELKELFYN